MDLMSRDNVWGKNLGLCFGKKRWERRNRREEIGNRKGERGKRPQTTLL